MDTPEAQQILRDHLKQYRTRARAELLPLLRSPDVVETVGVSGVRYQLEVQAVWDNAPNGNLRIIGAVDDGGLRAIVPLTDAFIVDPSGSLVGE